MSTSTVTGLVLPLLLGLLLITAITLNAYYYGKNRSNKDADEIVLNKSISRNWKSSIIALLIPYLVPFTLIYLIINIARYKRNNFSKNESIFLRLISLNTLVSITSLTFVFLMVFPPINSLGEAVAKSDYEKTKFFLDSGSNIDEIDLEGKTVLHIAAWHGNVKIGELLLNNGANVEGKNKMKMTALLTAAARNKPQFVELLLKHGANLYVEAEHDWNIFNYSILADNIKTIEYVLKLKPDMKKYKHMENPLPFAASFGSPAILDVFLLHKYDINYIDREGRTPLHHATIGGKLDSIKFLIQKGANFKTLKTKSMTPFKLSLLKGEVRIINYFIESGCDVNKNDNLEVPPLQFAILTQKPNIVEFLIQKGANINKRFAGETPLELAKNKKNKIIIDILKKHGAR